MPAKLASTMHKWIGIRTSAVLTILGSGLTLLFAGLLVWTALRASQLETPPESPFPVKPVLLVMAVLFAAFSLWGVASAIGIFRRRGWARLSMIVFACLLVGMARGRRHRRRVRRGSVVEAENRANRRPTIRTRRE